MCFLDELVVVLARYFISVNGTPVCLGRTLNMVWTFGGQSYDATVERAERF